MSGGNVQGTLPRGVRVGDSVYKDFEIRPSTAGDMFDAEDIAPATKQIAYRAALLSRQIVKLGELSGPIDFKLIRNLHPDDLNALLDKQAEADAEGKSAPSS